MSCVMEGGTALEDTNQSHRIEEGARQLAARVLFLTVQDCLDIWEYRRTKKYVCRYSVQFGFTKNADPEQAFKRVAKRIKTWIRTKRFKLLCDKIGLDVDRGRIVIKELLEGIGNDEIKLLVEEFQEELHHYAYNRGPKPGAKKESETEAQGRGARDAAARHRRNRGS